MTCAFCKDTSLQEREITSNDLARAFLGNIPIVPGHTLVVPKRCVSKYKDLTLEEKAAIEELRVLVCSALRKTFDAEGFNFAWNEGEGCGQSVPHFHLHIVPRKKGDVGVYNYEPREFLYRPGTRTENPEAELREVATIIRTKVEQ